MAVYKVEMTSVRVPKRIVEVVDDLRFGDPLGLSQGQMISKAVMAYSESCGKPNPNKEIRNNGVEV